jgi:hypothetical protein
LRFLIDGIKLNFRAEAMPCYAYKLNKNNSGIRIHAI